MLPDPTGLRDRLERDREAILVAANAIVGDRLTLDEYEAAVAQVLAARTTSELEGVARSLPFVQLVEPHAQLRETIVRTGVGIQRRRGGWHVGALTSVTTTLGSCWLDFTHAVFDSRETGLHVMTGLGFVRLIVPVWIGVEFVKIDGTVTSSFGHDTPPCCLPLLRLHATAAGGTIRLRRPRRS